MRSLILAAKRHWKRILKFLGVAGLIDLLKEFVRAKIMDWAYQRLGGFGQWMLDYPIAVLSLGIVAVLLALVVVAVKESRAKEFSHVLDITERPYEMARLSRTWSACFSIAVFAFAMATAYGTYNTTGSSLRLKSQFLVIRSSSSSRTSIRSQMCSFRTSEVRGNLPSIPLQGCPRLPQIRRL